MQRWLLVLLLASSLAAFAGTYSWSTVPLLAGAGVVALADRRRTFHFPRTDRVLDLALVATALAVALQLVPLPPGVVAILSPHAATVRGTLRLDAFALEGRAVPLSIEPRATLEALLLFVATVLVFWSARGAFSGGGVRRFCRLLAALGLLVAIEATVQRVLSPSLIYGYWRPTDIGAQPLGPFVNRNHFAGWVLMAIPAVAGYLAARVRIRMADARAPGLVRVLASAGALLLASLVVMLFALTASLSRSALVGLGAATVAAWFMARNRIEQAPRMTLPVLAAAGIGLVFLMTVVDPDRWAARLSATLEPTETSRLTIWRESWPVFRDFWLTGVGAGAYSMAMLLYQRVVIPMPHLNAFAHINQAHSHYVQVAVEGGVLLSLPVVIAAVALMKTARRALAADRGEAMWIRVGAGAALVGMATQSIWETALRMPANAFLCAALAGVLVHRRAVHHAYPSVVEEPGDDTETYTVEDGGHLVEHSGRKRH